MSSMVIGIACLGLFLLLMFLGLPIPFSMLFGGVVGLSIMMSPSATAQFVVADFISNFSSYALTVAPMFGLMGFLANYSGIGGDLFNTLNVFTRHRRGGLAMATQVACALFGAICGAVPATIATMSTIAYPEMRRRGYSAALAGNSIAAGSHLSCLIPPSSTFIIYAMATNASVGQLFIAGIGPGILLCILNILAVVYICKRHPEAAPLADPRAKIKEMLKVASNANLWIILIIFIVSMGGLFAGFFTPTEAGSVGAATMLIVTVIRRQVDLKKFMCAILDGVRLMAMVYMIMACATIFGRMFTISGVPTAIGNIVNNLNVSQGFVMAVIILIFFLLGMVTDLISMVLITMPIFYPIVVTQFGYDVIWFGALINLIISTGMLTPPVGGSIFVTYGCIKNDKEATLGRLFGGCWPFVIALLVATALLIIYPPIATWLVDVVYQR